MFQLVNFLVGVAFVLILVPLIPSAGDSGVPVGLAVWVVTFCAYVLVTIVPGLAVSVRRLHDADLSGLWLLLSFVPLGGFVILVFHLLDGTPGSNRYGPDPKGRRPSAMQYPPYRTQAMASVAGGGGMLPGGQPSPGGFCIGCGMPLQSGARFCPKCGWAAF